MLKKLFPYMKKYLLFIVLSPLAIILEILLELRIPYLMSKIVDVGIANKDIVYVTKIGGLMIVYSLLSLLMGASSAVFGSKAGIGFGTELRRGLFHKIQSFSFFNIDKYRTSSLITRLTSDIGNVQRAFMMLIRIAFRAPFMLVGATIMAYTINKSLVKIFLYLIPIVAISMIILILKAYPRFKKYLKEYDNLNLTLQENFISIRVVKSFIRSEFEKKKFGLSNDNLTKSAINSQKLLILGMPLASMTMYACIIAILWFGGNFIAEGTMKTGELISFISYVSQILMSIIMIMMVFINLVMSRASLGRIMDVLNEKIDITDENASENVVAENGDIEFKDVSFKYSKKSQEYVLEKINLKINSGEKIGIIGSIGSSKSTLVQLIPRLYDASLGDVFVGGHNVKDYKLSNLRNIIGMVLQNNVLFSGTIKENLKWGDKNASDDEIIEASENAQANNFISSFKEGYETYLGQGGVNISGGQKQRICIARALIKKPKILILDDSTSAVDTNTDYKIKKALDKNLSDTTVLIIAQRISSIDSCDKIIVMENGMVNAFDTPENLLENNEIYKDIYRSQQKGVE